MKIKTVTTFITIVTFLLFIIYVELNAINNIKINKIKELKENQSDSLRLVSESKIEKSHKNKKYIIKTQTINDKEYHVVRFEKNKFEIYIQLNDSNILPVSISKYRLIIDSTIKEPIISGFHKNLLEEIDKDFYTTYLDKIVIRTNKNNFSIFAAKITTEKD